MKKILLTLFLLFSSFSFNNGVVSNAESSPEKAYSPDTSLWEKKIADLEKEIYKQSLMQTIEFETELIIPEYFDFKYVEYLYNISNQLDIPTRVAFRLVYTESRFQESVVSPAGASGLMQLMPKTRASYYKSLRVDTLNLDKNQEDIYIGMYYIKDLQSFWSKRGNPEKILMKLSLAAYNASPDKVIRYKGIPPYKETQDFVTFILKPHSNPQFFASYLKKYGNEIKNRS